MVSKIFLLKNLNGLKFKTEVFTQKNLSFVKKMAASTLG